VTGLLDPRLSDALAAFDAGRAVTCEELLGRWRGSEVPTGHPMDGLLETYRWWGKAFRSADDVDPLLFEGRDGTVRALDPRRLPLAVAANGWAPRWRAAGALTALAHPLLATGAPRARLRDMEVRGVVTAAMVYDHLPVVDAFRRVGDSELLGLMDRRGDRVPFLFRLTRA
jgi:hypothetical protein